MASNRNCEETARGSREAWMQLRQGRKMQSGNTGRKAATESEWPAINSADKRVA